MPQFESHTEDFHSTQRWSELDDLLLHLGDDLDGVLKDLENTTPDLAEVLRELEWDCDRDEQRECWFEVLS